MAKPAFQNLPYPSSPFFFLQSFHADEPASSFLLVSQSNVVPDQIPYQVAIPAFQTILYDLSPLIASRTLHFSLLFLGHTLLPFFIFSLPGGYTNDSDSTLCSFYFSFHRVVSGYALLIFVLFLSVQWNSFLNPTRLIFSLLSSSWRFE